MSNTRYPDERQPMVKTTRHARVNARASLISGSERNVEILEAIVNSRESYPKSWVDGGTEEVTTLEFTGASGTEGKFHKDASKEAIINREAVIISPIRNYFSHLAYLNSATATPTNMITASANTRPSNRSSDSRRGQ